MDTVKWPLPPLATSIGNRRVSTILASSGASPRASISIPISEPSKQEPQTPRASPKTKDDIRYYFRPLPREDIRVYFRPISRIMIDRPRLSKAKVISSAEKAKSRASKGSPTSPPPSQPLPEIPPKAKARTSGQKNRDILLAKQQMKRAAPLGQTNQNGSAALPGFDPTWRSSQSIVPSVPLSPRITEVLDSSLLPPPLRNRAEAAAISAPEIDDRMDKQKDRPGLNRQPTVESQQSTVQEHQPKTSRQKPNSVYGTLPPLPVRLQRTNSIPGSQSSKVIRHRRQDTPHTPDDVGKIIALDIPDMPERTPSTSESTGRTSAYASSEALPTPIALEEWASERRRVAHGQPASTHTVKSVDKDNGPGKEKTLKKTKSVDAKFFRSKKGKHDRRGKVTEKIDQRKPFEVPESKPNTSQVTLSKRQDLHHPGARWDTSSLPPSPQLVRDAITSSKSDMDNAPRSASVSDKIVVEPRLVRAQSDQSSIVTTTVKLKKANKFLRVLEAYSKNVEGLQMVQ